VRWKNYSKLQKKQKHKKLHNEREWKNLKKSIKYDKSSYKIKRIICGVGEVGEHTNLQHYVDESNFTFGITIIIEV
jgi:hypothetical protein